MRIGHNYHASYHHQVCSSVCWLFVQHFYKDFCIFFGARKRIWNVVVVDCKAKSSPLRN